MKKINAVNIKKQRYFGRNTTTQMSRTALLKERVNWSGYIVLFLLFRDFHCKRLKRSVP